MVSEIGLNYAVHVSRNDFSHQRSLENYSLLVIQIIPAGSRLTPSSVSIHLGAGGIQNSSRWPWAWNWLWHPFSSQHQTFAQGGAVFPVFILVPAAPRGYAQSGLSGEPMTIRRTLDAFWTCFPGLLSPSRSPPSLPLCIPRFRVSRAALPSQVFKCFPPLSFPSPRRVSLHSLLLTGYRNKSSQELRLHILILSCCLTLGEHIHFPRPQFSPSVQWEVLAKVLVKSKPHSLTHSNRRWTYTWIQNVRFPTSERVPIMTPL